MRKKPSSVWVIGGLVAIVVVLIGVVVWQMGWLGGGSKRSILPIGGVQQEIEASEYSAVFLTNSQVYFGKLKNRDGQYLTLTDIYYLRTQEGSLQPPVVTDKDKKTVSIAQPAAQPELKLIKLGNELHGPKDEIQLNRDHILYIEELMSDSKVVTAIEKFKLQGGQGVGGL